MKDYINNFYHSITHIGASYPYENERAIQLVNFNILLLVGAIILTLSLSTNIISQSWSNSDTVLYIGGYSLIITFLFLNSIGRFKESTMISHLAVSLLFCAEAMTSGVIFICCIVNLVWMAISFRTLESTRLTAILSSIQLIFVNVTIFCAPYFGSGQDTILLYNPVERSIEYSLLFLFLFVITKHMTDQGRASNQRVHTLVSELEKKNSQLQRSYDEMESFSYQISHDLKSPLTTINSFASLLISDIEENRGEDIQEYCNFIYSGGMKMSKLIDDVLSHSMVNTRQLEKYDNVSLKDIIIPVKSNLKQIYPNSDVSLRNNGYFECCKTQLTLLLQNLIENGLKYNKSIVRKVTVDFMDAPEHCIIEVKDNGIGIDPKYQKEIFGLFKRLHTSEEYDGTGIGLSTCKKIVEDHLGGQLIVESTPNIGSTFKILIPKADHS